MKFFGRGKDLGEQKTEASKRNLEFHNIGETVIETHNFDVVKNWDKFCKLIEESTVVFQMIDVIQPKLI